MNHNEHAGGHATAYWRTTGTTALLRVYSAIGSDGYTADTRGNFDWAFPDEEVLADINAAARTVTTYLYGRRII